MKRFSLLLPVVIIFWLVTGCASVPSTKFTINPATGVVSLDSPKNVSFNNLDATLPNGNHIVLQGYSSTNAVDVIAAVAAANAAMADKLIDAVRVIESMAAKSAVLVQPPPSFQRPIGSDGLPRMNDDIFRYPLQKQ